MSACLAASEDDISAWVNDLSVVSPTLQLRSVAEPHALGLQGITTSGIQELFDLARSILEYVRDERPGKSEKDARKLVVDRLKTMGLNVSQLASKFESIRER